MLCLFLLGWFVWHKMFFIVPCLETGHCVSLVCNISQVHAACGTLISGAMPSVLWWLVYSTEDTELIFLGFFWWMVFHLKSYHHAIITVEKLKSFLLSIFCQLHEPFHFFRRKSLHENILFDGITLKITCRRLSAD